jgi:trehalose 6-phosphate phosphatase
LFQQDPCFVITKRSYDAVIFDLDGVITKTATIHAAAWKKLFDWYLEKRRGKDCKPFDPDTDYRRYVDGKPRDKGVQSFLASRGIELAYGSLKDDPDRETVYGLGNRKNTFFHEEIRKQGVKVYADALEFLHKLRVAGLKTAIISSSKNCATFLKAAHLTTQFDVKVDGVDSEELGLKGKPDPDIFLLAAQKLGVQPPRAIVVEDAIAGVQAGKKGNFGWVIGVDRTDHAAALMENGADMAVPDLGKIAVATVLGETIGSLRPALDNLEEIFMRLGGKRPAVFLDYDGTLTPIVDRPEDALLADPVRQTLRELAEHCTLAVISGRDLKDVQKLVDLESIFYAGSHGFDIAGPKGQRLEYQLGKDFLPELDQAEKSLRDLLEEKIAGVQVERKKFSIAVHYRRVEENKVKEVEDAVNRVQKEYSRLRQGSGKKVFELQPDIDWNKGKALLWLLSQLELDRPDVLPLYVGDDATDEDAFKVLAHRGLGFAVQKGDKPTCAQYLLRNPVEVEKLLQALIPVCQENVNE